MDEELDVVYFPVSATMANTPKRFLCKDRITLILCCMIQKLAKAGSHLNGRDGPMQKMKIMLI